MRSRLWALALLAAFGAALIVPTAAAGTTLGVTLSTEVQKGHPSVTFGVYSAENHALLLSFQGGPSRTEQQKIPGFDRASAFYVGARNAQGVTVYTGCFSGNAQVHVVYPHTFSKPSPPACKAPRPGRYR